MKRGWSERWPWRRDSVEIQDDESGDDESPEAPSVDVVFAEMRRTLDAQQAQITMLDTKAAFILTSASIIVGFSGLSGLGPDQRSGSSGWLIPALLVYLALIVSVIQAYRLRGFSSSGLEPETLPDYLFERPEVTKRQMIATMREIHRANVEPVNTKIRWLRRAEILLATEAAYFVLVIIGQSQWNEIRNIADRAASSLT
ncbi:MAG TPA: hypothetical protein VFV93_07715 [Thermomicrobiales bacterium]|nr:hypothetical protein [Thermomicrobiales bacterium]